MQKRPAFAYLRVSSKGQARGDGFPRQIAAIKKYAAAHHIEIIERFEEKLCGATELEHRAAWQRMLEALVANGTRLVLIEKLDRLARDLLVQETLLGDLRKRGFELISVEEPDLLQADPTRVLMRQIFGAIAQYDRQMLVAKLRGARERKAAAGGHANGLYAYGELPGEAAVRERIRSMREQGASYRTIAAVLNAAGTPTRYGKQWSPMQCQRISTRA